MLRNVPEAWDCEYDVAAFGSGAAGLQHLTRTQVNQLYGYIRAGARDELARQRAEKSGNPGDNRKRTQEKGRAASF